MKPNGSLPTSRRFSGIRRLQVHRTLTGFSGKSDANAPRVMAGLQRTLSWSRYLALSWQSAHGQRSSDSQSLDSSPDPEALPRHACVTRPFLHRNGTFCTAQMGKAASLWPSNMRIDLR